MNAEGLLLYVLLNPLCWHIRCCFAIGTTCPPVVVAGCYRNSERKKLVESNEDVSRRQTCANILLETRNVENELGDLSYSWRNLDKEQLKFNVPSCAVCAVVDCRCVMCNNYYVCWNALNGSTADLSFVSTKQAQRVELIVSIYFLCMRARLLDCMVRHGHG